MKKINLLLLILTIAASIQCKDDKKYIPIDKDVHNPHTVEADANKPFYQGFVIEKLDAGAYSYLKIEETIKGHEHTEGDEHDHSFWIAVNKTPAKVGDEVRFQKEMVTKVFESKVLKRTFEDLMFASNLQYRVKE